MSVARRFRALVACGLAAAMPVAWALQGVVTRVTDGDTVWVRTQPGARPLKVRVLGIDAPERCQPGGAAARDALSARVLHRAVELDVRAQDAYGRALATLSSGGEDLAAWLVRHGHAWSDRFQRRPGPYAAEEAEARRQRLGVFADPSAEEPRWFRRAHGPCEMGDWH